GIDVSLDEMTTEAAVRTHRALEIDERADVKPADGRHPQRFRADVGNDLGGTGLECGQADAIDRDAVAKPQFRRDRRRDSEADTAVCRLTRHDAAHRFNQACEHALPSEYPARAA